MYTFDAKQMDKVAAYRTNSIEPYPQVTEDCLNPNIHLILDLASNSSILELDSIRTVFSGRVRFKNEIGNAGFLRLTFDDIKLQVFISKGEIGPEDFKNIWKKLDLGDIVRVEGSFMRTRMGELSLRASSLQLLSKCIKGMPDKFSGVSDPETLQRQRYLDLMVNQDSYTRFKTRSSIISKIRAFLEEHLFMEVETTILQSIPGGATARPFTTHHNALDTELYMRIAPELYLKRLIVGGFPRVFEVGKNFRNEGISIKHNPEFTMVEFYAAYQNYHWLMDLTKTLITQLVSQINPTLEMPYGERWINYGSWKVITFMDAIKGAGVEDPWQVDSLKSFLNEPDCNDITVLWDRVFSQYVEPHLNDPTFITQYPVEISPLARRSDQDPRVTDRFELFIAGYEIANGFNELNDPVDQAERFIRQAERKSQGDDEAMYFDEDYITALSYGMPPTAGEGIGIDRLIMLLTNSQSIRDIILFPTKR